MNWAKMEDMKADVEPFPFVPAMCMGLRVLKSDGCVQRGQSEVAALSWNSESFLFTS